MSNNPPRLEGKVTDYGDLLHVEQWLVKGRRPRYVTRVSAPRSTTPADRILTPGAYRPASGKVDRIMDIQADKKVTLSIGTWRDEMENEAPAPEGVTVVWTVDRPDLIALTDLGDNTVQVATTGPLGNAVVHGEAQLPGGQVATSDDLFTVIPGDAVRFTTQASAPTEVSDDVVA